MAWQEVLDCSIKLRLNLSNGCKEVTPFGNTS